jgi:hypothetical protein
VSLWSGLQSKAVIVLMMCIRMLWLHCIVDVSGEGAPGMCFMILRLLDGWALGFRPWAVYMLDEPGFEDGEPPLLTVSSR